MRKIAFRFDIDSPKCIEVGVPNLLRLAREKNVKFNFMVNCGRSIDFRLSLKAAICKSPTPAGEAAARAPRLSARRKLGLYHYIHCALMNPRLSAVYPDQIRRLKDEGHEIGLHGGRNHETWARRVHTWSVDQIADEIAWGLERLAEFGIVPEIFSSPCAVSDARVHEALSRFKNFRYISDQLEPHRFEPRHLSPVHEVPVALSGEGGIAFVEQQIALGRDTQTAGEVFRERLRAYPMQVIYDHPYVAGDEGLAITSRLLDVALEEGYTFTGLCEIGDALYAGRGAGRAVNK